MRISRLHFAVGIYRSIGAGVGQHMMMMSLLMDQNGSTNGYYS